MRRIGHQNPFARIALGFEQRPHQQDAGQFPMRARRGLQRNRVQPRDLAQRVFQMRHHFHGALRQTLRLVRMRPRQTFQPRHRFIDARVVLHRAGTQRVHAEIDRIVPRGKPREVANHFHFADFRKPVDTVAHLCGTQRFGRIHHRHIERRQLIADLARRALFEDQPFVL